MSRAIGNIGSTKDKLDEELIAKEIVINTLKNQEAARAAKLATILFKSSHLRIINEAYNPHNRGYWKTRQSKIAKAALGQFITGKGHLNAEVLVKESFDRYTLDELLSLMALLQRVYSVSKQNIKHGLMRSLVNDLAISFYSLSEAASPTTESSPAVATSSPLTPDPINSGAGAGGLPQASSIPIETPGSNLKEPLSHFSEYDRTMRDMLASLPSEEKVDAKPTLVESEASVAASFSPEAAPSPISSLPSTAQPKIECTQSLPSSASASASEGFTKPSLPLSEHADSHDKFTASNQGDRFVAFNTSLALLLAKLPESEEVMESNP
jgi:hypothetical protein